VNGEKNEEKLIEELARIKKNIPATVTPDLVNYGVSWCKYPGFKGSQFRG